jgi:hypothetical protein
VAEKASLNKLEVNKTFQEKMTYGGLTAGLVWK